MCAIEQNEMAQDGYMSAMSKNTPQARTLRLAIDICGGLSALAKDLDVSVGEVLRWLEGQAVPPTRIYIRALDIVGGVPAPRRTQP